MCGSYEFFEVMFNLYLGGSISFLVLIFGEGRIFFFSSDCFMIVMVFGVIVFNSNCVVILIGMYKFSGNMVELIYCDGWVVC